MKFRDLIMQLSMPERVKRLNAKRHEEMTGLELLSDEELLFRYIEGKAMYEHQKRFFSLIMVTLLIAGFSDMWKSFYEFARGAFPGVYTEADLHALLAASLFICIFASAATLFLILSLLSTMRRTHRMLLMMEDVRNRRKFK